MATLCAAPAAPAADLALTSLGQGITAYNAHDLTGAIQHLRSAQGKVPRLADYLAYYLGYAELQSGDAAAAVRDFNAYLGSPVADSPLEGRIALWYSRALLDLKQPASNAKALATLRAAYRTLPQPDGDFALGLAWEAQEDRPQAVRSYQRVYFLAPNADLAADAGKALDRLRGALGAAYPLPTAALQLDRAARWLDARQTRRARDEYVALLDLLEGADLDAARVGAGAAELAAGLPANTLTRLKPIRPAAAETDARRLFTIVEAARRLNDDAEISRALAELAERHRTSSWRLKALLSAGNRYVVSNEAARYEPIFRAAASDFPASADTAYSHWKVAWDAWLGDRPETTALLREQIAKFPSDTRAASALFFLGRQAEKAGKTAEARAWYERASAQYQHYFYGVSARRRLEDPALRKATPEPAIMDWLDEIQWPTRRDLTVVAPNAATRSRIDRSRLLIAAGLPDAAQEEIQFGAKRDAEQAHLLAMELARSMPSAYHALRIMKVFSGDYLALPLEKAPLRFWEMLFPLPYRDDVVSQARQRELDPWLVAALIRQESEFNPAAHSRAGAYGLMQLMPPTGRELGRADGVTVASPSMLFNPTLSIRLGTRYLKNQLGAWEGDLAQTLAAYNAGPGRVRQWLGWMKFREPSEFIESIPFNETRDYVQAVLRNADMYRTLYEKPRPATPEPADPSDVPPVKLASLPAGMARKVAVAPRAAPKKATTRSAAPKTAAPKASPKKTKTR